MRSILKKIERRLDLSEAEYCDLLNYMENLQRNSPEAYAIFYDEYASILGEEYDTFIPRFRYGRDDFFNYLCSHPELNQRLSKYGLPLTVFPSELHPYLQYTFGSSLPVLDVFSLLDSTKSSPDLPQPRSGMPVFKYEDSNPYKERGLKTHFERLARYSFVTRLQSYRYLTRGKASCDRMEYVSPDCLGGIFTNKQKSIYYYLFLSEADEIKAHNACALLNLVFYSREKVWKIL
jgi:hypothetical protein